MYDLSGPNLILSRDLNLILNTVEIWGDYTRLDPLSDFFLELFQKHKLGDIVPPKIDPTLKNDRTGSDGICKKLDRFSSS